MPLVTLHELQIRFRGPPLLDGVSCRIEPGERIGLLGRNGSGKSTLLHILNGGVEPDSGKVTFAPNTKVALMPQQVPRDLSGSVSEVVASGLLREDGAAPLGWRDEQRVDRALSRTELDGESRFEQLSSGMKRRVLLARTLAAEPDVLLLDEPTNHLDIDAIEWLERFLERWASTLIFVTHDRAFLRKLARRILELDRGSLFDWSCDYDTFLKRKEDWIAAEAKQNAAFDRRLAEEEVWIRKGIRDRRTRNEGRVRSLKRMRMERQERREIAGRVRMELPQEKRSGQLIAHLENVSFAYGDRAIVRNFSTAIMRGDKVGVIGPNGAGKTTLLRLLLGELAPTEGSVRLGTHLQIAYFDQLRGQLDEDKNVLDNVADGYDSVRVGDTTKHVIGYVQDFLFTPERARVVIRYLSGGERTRVLLARLFAKPANVIVLDEPTNDLDAETLELLEELLVDYCGTVLMVSHDRAFLNNVVTSTIVFEEGGLREYCGGYDDWQRQRSQMTAREEKEKLPRTTRGGKSAATSKKNDASSGAETTKRRLTYKEQQELGALPERIEAMEREIAARHEAMAGPEFYQRPGEEIARETNVLRQREARLSAAYERWEELEERNG
ncbi:MAG: ATP-binding cassette domain-containing protein [Pirellulaceae bacterium]